MQIERMSVALLGRSDLHEKARHILSGGAEDDELAEQIPLERYLLWTAPTPAKAHQLIAQIADLPPYLFHCHGRCDCCG